MHLARLTRQVRSLTRGAQRLLPALFASYVVSRRGTNQYILFSFRDLRTLRPTASVEGHTVVRRGRKATALAKRQARKRAGLPDLVGA